MLQILGGVKELGSNGRLKNAAAFPFIVVIAIQMLFSIFSVYTMSAIRSVVATQNIWVRNQVDATYFLQLYLAGGDEADFVRYKASMVIPLEMHDGRLAMAAIPPNTARAKAAFAKAGMTTQDASSMMWLLNYFSKISYLEKAIDLWVKADNLLLSVDDLANRTHDERHLKTVTEKNFLKVSEKIEGIKGEINIYTIGYAKTFGEAGKFIENLLLIVNATLALGLTLLTIWRVRRFLKQRRAIEAVLMSQASHDSMTGIANRRAFETRLTDAMSTVSADPVSHALIFLDLDQFKIVNDTSGHTAGDELLRRICTPLQRELQIGDLLARLGGDEFGILLTNCTMLRAASVAENLRIAVENLDFVTGHCAHRVTASIGLVHTDQGILTQEEMMSAADMACFMAKEKGRNRVHIHRCDDRDLVRHAGEMNWVQRIHQALNAHQFCLYAQDIIPLRASDHGVHLEILLRLRDETGAIVPPASFLPAAERFGLMPLIDRWVVNTAFETLAARLRDPAAEAIACCSINLSGITIGDEAFLSFLDDRFAAFGICPSTVCFEITETSAITHLDAATAFVRDLRARGCRFSLDDFGAGMSSFGYLKQLPVDFIKIDGGFVKNMLVDPVDRAMVETITHIGHVMGKRIIAEFVEDKSIANGLFEIGVDYAQGYAISRPRPFNLNFKAASFVDEIEMDRTAA